MWDEDKNDPMWKRPNFPRSYSDHQLESCIAGLTAAVKHYDSLLSGEYDFPLMRRLLADHEGRDLMAETKQKLEFSVLARVCAAEELRRRGIGVPYMNMFVERLERFDG